jgi:hypothetical protein
VSYSDTQPVASAKRRCGTLHRFGVGKQRDGRIVGMVADPLRGCGVERQDNG